MYAFLSESDITLPLTAIIRTRVLAHTFALLQCVEKALEIKQTILQSLYVVGLKLFSESRHSALHKLEEK